LDQDHATDRVLTSNADGYRVIDLSDPANPKFSATGAISSWEVPVMALGPDYYVAVGGAQNIAVYPISWSQGLRLTDRFPASPYMIDMRVRDGYLYWTGAGYGYPGRSATLDLFQVVDVSTTPSRVVARMSRPLDEVGYAIELIGHYAYVGTDSELVIYDIASPLAPVQMTVIPQPAISMALSGTLLYVGSYAGKSPSMLLYDVSNPAAPRQLSSIPLPGFAYSLSANSGRLVAAMGKSGIIVYSIANPTVPSILKIFTGTFWGAVLSGNLVYLAADSLGLWILDVSAGGSGLAAVGRADLTAGDDTWDFPYAMAVSLDARGIAWVSSLKDARVYGFDIRDPAHPRHIAELVTSSTAVSAENTLVSNGQLYVGGYNAAFDVNIPQNVGIYEVRQPYPGAVLPDRYNDQPPVAHRINPPGESFRVRMLRQKLDR
jgi:hypothetical protein